MILNARDIEIQISYSFTAPVIKTYVREVLMMYSK